MLAIEAPDPARAERTHNRSAVHRRHYTDQIATARLLAAADPAAVARVELAGMEYRPAAWTREELALDRPDGDQPYSARSAIYEWSQDSRSNMWKVLGSLDYGPVTAGGRVTTLTTLTLPGNWEAVCPDGRAWKAMRDTLRKRYERAWGEPLTGPWKNEYQRRGAPHIAFAHAVPWGVAGQYRRAEHEAKMAVWEAAGRVGRRPYFRAASGDGLQFRQWLSLVWTEIVFPPDPAIGPCRDPDERRKHLAAGTSVDVREGMRFQDPRRLMVYFAKHGQFRAKEYQNRIPEQWQAPGKAPGRFWGYWGLRPAVARVELDPETDWDLLARMLRRWSAADYRSAPVTRQVAARRVDTRTGRVRRRKVRRRVRRMRGSLGFMVVSDGPRLAAQLARVLEATGSVSAG